MRKHYLLPAMMLYASTGFSGGTIGGGGPSVQLNSSHLQSLQESALKGDLIRVTQPGADPVYLRPDLGSMKTHSFSANALPSGQETVFYAEPPAEKIQIQIALSMARSMKASSGLPVMPSDFEPSLKYTVDSVPMSEIYEHTIYRTEEPEITK